jgi:hypothetical protein
MRSLFSSALMSDQQIALSGSDSMGRLIQVETQKTTEKPRNHGDFGDRLNFAAAKRLIDVQHLFLSACLPPCPRLAPLIGRPLRNLLTPHLQQLHPHLLSPPVRAQQAQPSPPLNPPLPNRHPPFSSSARPTSPRPSPLSLSSRSSPHKPPPLPPSPQLEPLLLLLRPPYLLRPCSKLPLASPYPSLTIRRSSCPVGLTTARRARSSPSPRKTRQRGFRERTWFLTKSREGWRPSLRVGN